MLENKIKEVSVLGTIYTISEKTEQEDALLSEINGYIDRTSKKIIIKRLENSSRMDLDNLDEIKNETIRHEIIHAFFYESGLSDYAMDETLVQYLAMQLPKINKAVKFDKTT